jgi:hypothetical protein
MWVHVHQCAVFTPPKQTVSACMWASVHQYISEVVMMIKINDNSNNSEQ